jgi:hypothetical protein
MGKRLDAVPTELTFQVVATALDSAWIELLGRRPAREAVALLLAQSAFETGHWKKSYCYNLGNAKATKSWDGDFCFYFADEIVSEKQAAEAFALRAPRTDGVAGHNVQLARRPSGQVRVTLFPDHPWCRFRAFTSLADGVHDYLELLHKRFHGAWPAVEAGDPEGFIRGLKELRYFTTSVDSYMRPVHQLFNKFSKALAETALGDTAVEPRLPAVPSGRPTVKRGARGQHVLEVQGILQAMGYEGVTRSGVFDEALVSAVELFQLQHVDDLGRALVSDGEIGPRTWWALLNASGEAQRNNLPPPSTAGLTPTRTKLLELLHDEHGKPVFETPDGSNRSPDIDRYFGRTGILGKPWCCAFVSWALKEAMGTFPIDGKHHLGVQAMWVRALELGMSVSDPKPGDIFIQIKSGGTGHTGFVVGLSGDGNVVYTCEGNCGNRVKYGHRPRSSIHHFIDCIRDGQGNDFSRDGNLEFEDVDADGTR